MCAKVKSFNHIMTRKLSLFFVQLMYTTANSTRTLMFEAQAHTCIYSNTTTPSFTCVRRHELHCCLKLIKYPYKKRTLIYIYFFYQSIEQSCGTVILDMCEKLTTCCIFRPCNYEVCESPRNSSVWIEGLHVYTNMYQSAV